MSNILKALLAVGVAGVLNSQTSLADEPMPGGFGGMGGGGGGGGGLPSGLSGFGKKK